LVSSRFSLGPFWWPAPSSMIPDGSGGLLVSGWHGAALESEPGGWVGRFDAAGMLLWSHEYVDANLSAAAPDGQGGMFAGGAFFARYDLSGNQVWSVPSPGFTVGGLAADSPLGVWVAGGMPGGGAIVARYGACYANCDGSTMAPVLNINDFLCFESHFAAGDPYSNCDHSTIPPLLNITDFICFQARFAAGCP
jgi:hypothetical protein